MATRFLKATGIGSISALALAAMSGTAAADTSLDFYGFIHANVDYNDAAEGEVDFRATGDWVPSRLGVRGEHELAPGVTGLAVLEYGHFAEFGEGDLDEGEFQGSAMAQDRSPGVRLGYAGMDFEGVGTVTLGSQWSLHYDWVTVQTDLFFGDHRNVHAGPHQPRFRPDNNLQFRSASFGGFQFAVEATADRDTPDDDIDEIAAAVRYQQGPLTVAATILDEQADDGETVIAAAGTYDFDVVALSLLVNDYDEADTTNFEFAAAVPVTEQWTVSGIVNLADDADDGDDVIGYGAEAVYSFPGGNFAYVGISDNDADDDSLRANVGYGINF